MMKAAVFAFVLGAIIQCGNAAAIECPDYAEPQITISPKFNGPAYDNSLTMRELKLYASKDGILSEEEAALRSKENTRIGGLTVQRPSILTTFEIDTKTLPDKSVCAQITKMNLTMTIAHPIVYIAQEFPVNSCSYNAVLAHELKHVSTVKNFLYGFPSVAEEHLKEFLRHLGVIHGGPSLTAQEVNQTVDRELKHYFKKFEKELVGALSLMEHRVDSPEEYARISASCDGNTQKIFNAAK